MTQEFSQQIFQKFSNIEFHENPSSGSRVVPCGRTEGQGDIGERAQKAAAIAKLYNKTRPDLRTEICRSTNAASS